jgi:hypothetical protein
MDMRTVYRYENYRGEGPYCAVTWPNNEDLFSLLRAHDKPDHPAWYNSAGKCVEYGRELSADYHSACDSRESLDAWFDGWHEVLEENGFRVKEYTVQAENVLESRSGLQVAFRR